MLTDDIDRIRAEMTRAISEHAARPEPGVRKISAAKTEANIGNFGLIQISYGAGMTIQAETCGPNYLVQVPLSGRAQIQNGRDVISSHPGMATIIHPTSPLNFQFSHDLDLLVVRLPAEKLEQHCAQILGERDTGIAGRLRFDLGLSLEGAKGAQWLRLLSYMREEAISGDASLLLQSPLALTSFEQLLMNGLLSLQPHSYADALLRSSINVAPSFVRRAEEFMRHHAAEPLSIVDVANAAGTSVRSLHRGFQEYRGTSPLATLKAIRLQNVYNELLAGEPQHVSITAVALKWGVMHVGHFGQDYKNRFGETPIATLRRTR